MLFSSLPPYIPIQSIKQSALFTLRTPAAPEKVCSVRAYTIGRYNIVVTMINFHCLACISQSVTVNKCSIGIVLCRICSIFVCRCFPSAVCSLSGSCTVFTGMDERETCCFTSCKMWSKQYDNLVFILRLFIHVLGYNKSSVFGMFICSSVIYQVDVLLCF